MNIKRVKYKMSNEEDWKVGYVIGKYEGENTTLLDFNFKYVPKIMSDGKEFLVYDMIDDYNKYLNITIPL